MTLEPEELAPTGIYDLETKQAVEAFQRFFELDKDKIDYQYGVADTETLVKIVEENIRILTVVPE